MTKFDEYMQLANKLVAEQELNARLGLITQAAHHALVVKLAELFLLDDKQKDYGPHNISSCGTAGVIVRANDKCARLVHMTFKRKGEPVNESIEDSFVDLANYGTIGYMVQKGLWPNE